MSDPEPREGPGSVEPERPPGPEGEPMPRSGSGRFGLDLGNPIERESAAFSWLVVVIIAAISIGAIARLVSPLAAVIWILILLAALSVPIFRGLKHGLGSPEDDE